jgi:hypothetical protein
MQTSTPDSSGSLARRLAPAAVTLACTPALGVAAATSAHAGAPTLPHFSGSFSEVDTETCGFPITNDETFASDVQLFYDQDANLDHSLAHIQLRGTDSANGVTLADDADWTHTYDFTTGINGDIGLAERVLVPNGGAIAFEAGRVLFVRRRHRLIRCRATRLHVGQPGGVLRPRLPGRSSCYSFRTPRRR